jgi:hypothetical protein
MEHADFRRSTQIDSLRLRSAHHHRAARVRAQPRSSPSPELSDALFAAARCGRRLLQRGAGRFPAVGALQIPGDVSVAHCQYASGCRRPDTVPLARRVKAISAAALITLPTATSTNSLSLLSARLMDVMECRQARLPWDNHPPVRARSSPAAGWSDDARAEERRQRSHPSSIVLQPAPS